MPVGVKEKGEDNGGRSDGCVKRDLFRCQQQKDLPKSGIRKSSPQGEERGRQCIVNSDRETAVKNQYMALMGSESTITV